MHRYPVPRSTLLVPVPSSSFPSPVPRSAFLVPWRLFTVQSALKIVLSNSSFSVSYPPFLVPAKHPSAESISRWFPQPLGCRPMSLILRPRPLAIVHSAVGLEDCTQQFVILRFLSLVSRLRKASIGGTYLTMVPIAPRLSSHILLAESMFLVSTHESCLIHVSLFVLNLDSQVILVCQNPRPHLCFISVSISTSFLSQPCLLQSFSSS